MVELTLFQSLEELNSFQSFSKERFFGTLGKFWKKSEFFSFQSSYPFPTEEIILKYQEMALSGETVASGRIRV